VGVYFSLDFSVRLGFISIMLRMPLMCICMKNLCWYILWLKMGRKMVYLYSMNACVCAILHLFRRFACYAYACIAAVVSFILQLFQVCVDVVTNVATSCCS